MSPPQVSIVIPCHNAARWLATAVTSALNQEGVAAEVIVVDDGSTDDSREIAGRFAPQGVRLIVQDRRGAAAARNHGRAVAQGEWLQFLDADDWLAPHKLRRQVDALQSAPPGCLAVGGLASFDDGDDPAGAPPYRGWPLSSTDDPVGWLLDLYGRHGHGGMVQPGQWLVPRAVADTAGPWDETLTLDDDGEYFCRVVLNSAGLVKTPGAVAGYRLHRRSSRNLSAQKSASALDSLWRALAAKERHLRPRADAAGFRRAFAWSYFSLAVEAYPAAPELSARALARSSELGGCEARPVVGGPLLQAIAEHCGWKFAKRLSACAARLRRSRRC